MLYPMPPMQPDRDENGFGWQCVWTDEEPGGCNRPLVYHDDDYCMVCEHHAQQEAREHGVVISTTPYRTPLNE